MKRLAIALGGLLTASASAQIPDVKLHLDAIGSLRFQRNGNSDFRYYSAFGQYSTVSLQFELEPGFTGFLAQKLDRIRNDGDRDSVDQAYVEDEGIWRIGKQYLPFGSGQVLRETGMAVRGDTTLIFEQLPLRMALVDSGQERQRGFIGRMGTNLGMSVAVGRHFGINGTALTQIRRPEDAPGEGRGWRNVLGFDARQRFGAVDLRGEIVLLRDGETAADADTSILDASAYWVINGFADLTLGYTREANSRTDFLRAVAEIETTENLWLRPFVRMKSGRVWDYGVELRFKL